MLDTGAPESIWSEDWLQRSNWHPITHIPLPPSTRPYRFARQHVKPLYGACIVCEVNAIHVNPSSLAKSWSSFLLLQSPFSLASTLTQTYHSKSTSANLTTAISQSPNAPHFSVDPSISPMAHDQTIKYRPTTRQELHTPHQHGNEYYWSEVSIVPVGFL